MMTRHPIRTNVIDDRLADLGRSLAIINASGRDDVLTTVTNELAEAFGAGVFAYRALPGADGWELELFAGAHGGPSLAFGSVARVRSHFAKFLQAAPRRWSAHDALRPEPGQRNRVFGPKAMRRLSEGNVPVVTRVYGPLGLTRPDHMRLLICDGPHLLSWLGVFRTEPLAREDVRRLGRLVGPLRRRLRIDRMLNGSLTMEAMSLAMEAIAAPAFLVRSTGTIEFSNEAGRVMFDRCGQSLVRSIQAAVAGRGPEGISVTPLQSPGVCSQVLVVMHGESASSEARLALAAKRWELSPRQIQVVALLARGDTNKDLAAKLHCGPRTAEIHVSAILRKASVESRGQLIAKFWTQT